MDKRNIALTLEEAKELYKNGDESIKSLILSSFTEGELTMHDWENIKSFEDACKALNLDIDVIYRNMQYFPYEHQEKLIAIYKLSIISEALNGDWKPKMDEEIVYHPCIRYVYYDIAKRKAKENGWSVHESFIADGEKYTLISDCSTYTGNLVSFEVANSGVPINVQTINCKSKAIALHIAKYFAKEIFDACYGQYVNAYEWC